MQTPCGVPARVDGWLGLEDEPVRWSFGWRVVAALLSGALGAVAAYCFVQLWLYGAVQHPAHLVESSTINATGFLVFSIGAGSVAGLGSVMLHLARDGLYP